MPTEVEVAGEGIFEFPDGMGDDEIQGILRNRFPVQELPQQKQFKRDELAKQTFQARLEGEQAKALTGLTDIGTEAAKAVVRAASHVDPTGFTQGLMQQYGVEPTHVIPPEAILPDVRTVSEFARQGLGNLGIDPNVILPEQYRKPAEEFVAETIASTPEMAPLLAAGTVAPRAVGRVFQAQMLQGVPQTAYQAFTAPTAEERIKAGIQTGAGLAFPALIERGMRTPTVPIPDFIGRQLEMQRGAIPPRAEPIAPIERVTPEQAAIAAERMSAPFEEKLPTEPTVLAPEKVEGAPIEQPTTPEPPKPEVAAGEGKNVVAVNPDAQSLLERVPRDINRMTGNHDLLSAARNYTGEPLAKAEGDLYKVTIVPDDGVGFGKGIIVVESKAKPGFPVVTGSWMDQWEPYMKANYGVTKKGYETTSIGKRAEMEAWQQLSHWLEGKERDVFPEHFARTYYPVEWEKWMGENKKPSKENPKFMVSPFWSKKSVEHWKERFFKDQPTPKPPETPVEAAGKGEAEVKAVAPDFMAGLASKRPTDKAGGIRWDIRQGRIDALRAKVLYRQVGANEAIIEINGQRFYIDNSHRLKEAGIKTDWAHKTTPSSVKTVGDWNAYAAKYPKLSLDDFRRYGQPKVEQPAQPITQGPGDKLQALTAKVESGEKLTASEKKQYLKLRDEATQKQPELAREQVSAGPGAGVPFDIGAESAAQSAGIRTAEHINRGLETKDIKTQPDIAVPEADLKMADPQVEARWKAAKLSQTSPLEKAKAAVAATKNAMTRHFRFLDPKKDGVVTDILRVHENDPLHAKFLASQVMRGITEGLKPKKYDVFSRIVILRDLAKYGEQFGQDLADLPFGYKSWDAVKNDLNRFNALAEKYPDIKESLRRRDEFMDALRYDLVARGLLNEKVKDFGEYFHHQVLQYMALKEPFASTGSTDVRTHGKGWQKGRTGSTKDYNTSYLESEFEVISQAFAQMATQDTLKQLKSAADISDQLKIAAKDARESGSDVTWEQLIPEDHTIWQPQQGNHFYWVNTITEKALDAYLKGQKQLTEADIKEALAMGGPREQWVIPKRLAKTLDDFKPPVDHAIEKVIGAGQSQWKRWTLFNPMRNVIYELNNLSGDADIAFAVDPKIFKYAPQSAKEVAEFVRAKKGASKEMSDLVRLGVIDSGFSVQELPDLKGNQFFRALEGKDPSLVQRYWENVLDFNRWREGVLRLASYKRAMELLESGKKPYWTSKQAEMDALYKDPNVTREQIAAKLAREAIGDYGNISYAGQWIRSKAIPFYSWMEINAPRYVRLMQNASREEGGIAGRVAGVAGKKVLTQSAKLAARMSAFYFLANLWNRSMFPEEDKELNSTDRSQFHVILGHNDDGTIRSLRLQGAFSDALSWFGAQDLIKDVKDIQSGLATPKEKAIEMAKSPVNKVAQGAFPIYKTLFEALVKKQTYPDVFNPRPVRDSKAHIARMVSLGSVYDYLAKHPQRPGTWTLKALATYTTDPGEAAYMTAKSIVSDKLKEMNVERPGAEPTEKSNALYYWKQSIRYKNPKLEEYWRNRYQELGGKTQYLDTGLRNTSPYNGVSKANRGKFESLLSPTEKDIMQRADDWYRKTYIER